MTVIKFCGLTNLQDCLDAIDAGAGWLGFNFYPPSPRSITPDACRRLVAELDRALRPDRQKVRLVGVFVNEPPETILHTLDNCGLDFAQLSGTETPEMVRACGERAYAAVRATASGDLDGKFAMLPRRNSPPAALVDAAVAGQFGGTGQIADWEQARALARRAQFFLAGGLTPANVTEAVCNVRPWGVDTASGIESAPGRKDAGKMSAFVQAVREAGLEQERQNDLAADR